MGGRSMSNAALAVKKARPIPIDDPTTATVRELEVQLDDDAILEATQMLCERLSRLHDAESVKSASMRAFNVEIKGIEAQINRIADTIRTRTDLREVNCTERWDYLRGEVICTRDDTGAEIGRRAISSEERQTNLDGVVDAI